LGITVIKWRQMGEGAGAVVMVIASVTFVHVVWWLVGDSVVTFGNLVDSDGYARLVRIQRLLETGAGLMSVCPAPTGRMAGRCIGHGY